MELIDVGVKMPSTEAVPAPVSTEGKNSKRYPTLYLDMIPDFLADKPMGHKCKLVVVAKVVGKHQDDLGEGQRNSIELKILKVGYSAAGEKSKEEYLQMGEKEREAYDRESIEDDEEGQDDEESSEADDEKDEEE